jgi:hypothetical protein
MAEMVDSQQKMLDPQDIIGIAAMNLDSPFDYNQVVNAIAEELNMEETLYLREGNTLFILHKVAPGKAFFRALNADTANNFLQNSTVFITACNKLGFDTVASLFTDPVVVGVFRYIAKRPPIENMGYRLESVVDNAPTEILETIGEMPMDISGLIDGSLDYIEDGYLATVKCGIEEE